MKNCITCPDIVGYSLSDAINVLNEYGIEISSMKIPAPPRHATGTYNDSFRILKVFAVDDNRVVFDSDPLVGY